MLSLQPRKWQHTINDKDDKDDNADPAPPSRSKHINRESQSQSDHKAVQAPTKRHQASCKE